MRFTKALRDLPDHNELAAGAAQHTPLGLQRSPRKGAHAGEYRLSVDLAGVGIIKRGRRRAA